MVEEKDVKETTPVEPVKPQEEKAPVGEPVKAPETVDRKVYEQVRDDMKAEREAKKSANVKNAELEARIAELETRPVSDDDTDQGDVRTKAKVEILYLVQSDPFVKENLDLIEDKMADNPKMTAQTAIKELKSDFFDKMQKEVSQSEPEKPLKQLNPKGDSTIKGEDEEPRQDTAINSVLSRLPKHFR